MHVPEDTEPKFIAKTDVKEYISCFLLGVLWIQILYLSNYSVLSLFLQMVIQCHSFACGNPLPQHDWATSLSCIGEGNGNPLQCSCPENPRDRGAWWAAVHGVAKSQTRLSDFTFMLWRRKWQPTPVFLPGESQGQGSLVGCHLWRCTELERLSDLAAAAAELLKEGGVWIF